MGLLSAAMKAELQKVTNGGRAEIYRLVDVAFPAAAGGTRRYAHGGVVKVATSHQYDGRLLSIGEMSYGVPTERELRLAMPEVEIRFDDTDDFFTGLLEGVGPDVIRYAPVTITKASPNVTNPADWQTEFVGVLDRWALALPKVWTWTLTFDALPLRRFFPKTPLTGADWPNASSDVISSYGPLIHGRHDSSGSGNTNTGAVDLLKVDSVLNRYLVCYGWAKSVDRVFADGVFVSTGYTVDHPVVNGRQYTVVTFTTAQGNKAITADVQGYETVGDGSGTLIEVPSDQIKHLLVNWIYGDYKTGAWLADASAPVDTTWFATAAAFLNVYAIKGSRRIFGEQQRGQDAFEEWCNSTPRLMPFITQAGKLALRADDHRGSGFAYLDDPWLREDKHELAFSGVTNPTTQIIDRVSIRYLRNDAADDFVQSLEVRDPGVTKEAPDSLELPWSAAYLS